MFGRVFSLSEELLLLFPEFDRANTFVPHQLLAIFKEAISLAISVDYVQPALEFADPLR